jgi:hypothetical protein
MSGSWSAMSGRSNCRLLIIVEMRSAGTGSAQGAAEMRFANGKIQASPHGVRLRRPGYKPADFLARSADSRTHTYLLKAGDIADAAAEFQQYGVLTDDQIPGDDRISHVTYECDLTDMVEKMLQCGLDDPVNQIGNWLQALQSCSKRLGEELLKIQGQEGPPPRFPPYKK